MRHREPEADKNRQGRLRLRLRQCCLRRKIPTMKCLEVLSPPNVPLREEMRPSKSWEAGGRLPQSRPAIAIRLLQAPPHEYRVDPHKVRPTMPKCRIRRFPAPAIHTCAMD